MDSRKRKIKDQKCESMEEKRACVEKDLESERDIISDIPPEMILHIISFLDWKSIISFAGTSTGMQDMVAREAKFIVKQKGRWPVIVTPWVSTDFRLEQVREMLSSSTIPAEYCKFVVHRTASRKLQIARGLGSFHFKSASQINFLDLNGAKNIFIRHMDTEGKFLMGFIVGAECVKTATFRNPLFRGKILDSFITLHTCVFLNTDFVGCSFHHPIRKALFYGCEFTNCTFDNIEEVLLIACINELPLRDAFPKSKILNVVLHCGTEPLFQLLVREDQPLHLYSLTNGKMEGGPLPIEKTNEILTTMVDEFTEEMEDKFSVRFIPGAGTSLSLKDTK